MDGFRLLLFQKSDKIAKIWRVAPIRRNMSAGQFPSLYWAACCGLLAGGLRFVASDKGMVFWGLSTMKRVLFISMCSKNLHFWLQQRQTNEAAFLEDLLKLLQVLFDPVPFLLDHRSCGRFAGALIDPDLCFLDAAWPVGFKTERVDQVRFGNCMCWIHCTRC